MRKQILKAEAGARVKALYQAGDTAREFLLGVGTQLCGDHAEECKIVVLKLIDATA